MVADHFRAACLKSRMEWTCWGVGMLFAIGKCVVQPNVRFKIGGVGSARGAIQIARRLRLVRAQLLQRLIDRLCRLRHASDEPTHRHYGKDRQRHGQPRRDAAS